MQTEKSVLTTDEKLVVTKGETRNITKDNEEQKI